MEAFSKAKDAISNAVQSAGSQIASAQQSVQESVSSNMNKFSSAVDVGGTQEFLSSNGVVGKFFFIIFILIAFMLLFRLGVMILGEFFGPAGSPYLVKGMINGAAPQVITQDSNGQVLLRSNNKNTGIEFTWSVWLNIFSVNPNASTDQWSWIFNKGNNEVKTAAYNDTNAPGGAGVATVNNGPGLYISNKKNKILFVMDVISSNQVDNPAPDAQTIVIDNIPIGKWFHLCLRLENKVLDAYVNGVIYSRKTFLGTPKQNNDNVYLFQNGGFPGQLSNLRYFDHALTIFQINSLVSYGPNLTSAKLGNQYNGNYDYLSSAWYTSQW